MDEGREGFLGKLSTKEQRPSVYKMWENEQPFTRMSCKVRSVFKEYKTSEMAKNWEKTVSGKTFKLQNSLFN